MQLYCIDLCMLGKSWEISSAHLGNFFCFQSVNTGEWAEVAGFAKWLGNRNGLFHSWRLCMEYGTGNILPVANTFPVMWYSKERQ